MNGSGLFRYFLALVAVSLLSGCDGGGNGRSSTPDLIQCDSASGEVGQVVQISCRKSGASPVSVSWTALAPNGSEVPIAGSGLSATFTPQLVGNFEVKAKAVSGSESETERVVVAVGYPAPDISCPSQISIPAQRPVTIDCTVTDSASRALTYEWSLTPPAGVTVSLQSTNTEDTEFTPPSEGRYTLELAVTAAEGKSARAIVHVEVGKATSWKIVAIGDSITQSNLLHQSYRYELWKRLVDSGVDFDLVGTQTDNSNACVTSDGGVACENNRLPDGTSQVARPPYKGRNFDPHHEGYWGRTAGQVLTLLRGNLPALKGLGLAPDIALVHLGTNDLLLGSGTTQNKAANAINGLEGIIDELRAQNPRVTIIIAQIIPFSGDSGEVPILNSLIDKLDESKAQAGSPIIIVDQYSGFDLNSDTFDGIHPDDSGEQKIASKFFAEVEKIIK